MNTIEKYDFGFDMQQLLLGAMLKDIYFLKQSTSLIKPYYFQDNTHVTICSIILSFFDKYEQIPKIEYIEQEISERFPDDENRRKSCLYEVKTILDCYEPGIESRDYLTDKVSEFAKIQTLKEAILKSTDLLGQKVDSKWDKIYKILNDALMVERCDDLGLDYFGTVEERYERMMKQKETGDVFTSGFHTIDNTLQAGGWSRGECIAFAGSSGMGKSNLLIRTAVRNLVIGKKVLYISLEMDADKIANRVDSLISLCNINELYQSKEIVFHAVNEHVSGYMDKKRLIIKQYPGGTAGIKDIKAYMSQLEMNGFKCDLLCVDYIGEMKFEITHGIPLHQLLYHASRDLRRLATEENILVTTAVQGTRGTRDVMESGGVMQDNHISSSYDIVKPLDGLYSINQSLAERAGSVGRIFIAKQRAGKSGIPFYYKQLPNLDFNEINKEAYVKIMNSVQESVSESVELPKKFKSNG